MPKPVFFWRCDLPELSEIQRELLHGEFGDFLTPQKLAPEYDDPKKLVGLPYPVIHHVPEDAEWVMPSVIPPPSQSELRDALGIRMPDGRYIALVYRPGTKVYLSRVFDDELSPRQNRIIEERFGTHPTFQTVEFGEEDREELESFEHPVFFKPSEKLVWPWGGEPPAKKVWDDILLALMPGGRDKWLIFR